MTLSLLFVIICDLLDDSAPSVEDAGSEGRELHEVDEVVDRVSGLSHEGVGLVFRSRDLLSHTPGHQASQWSHGAGMYVFITECCILIVTNLGLKRTDMLMR